MLIIFGKHILIVLFNNKRLYLIRNGQIEMYYLLGLNIRVEWLLVDRMYMINEDSFKVLDKGRCKQLDV